MRLRSEATSRFETVGTTPPDRFASRVSVLFVDDDPLIRELVSRRLWEGGFSGTAAGLSDAALAYLETRGISTWDLSLLADYATDFEREKEVARRLGRNAPAVRKRFQAIRDGLGLASQDELVRLIRALSGFGQKTAATCAPPF